MTDDDLEAMEAKSLIAEVRRLRTERAVMLLLTEVARLRAERSAMLDALEAGQGLADLDTWPWEDRQSAVGEWDDRIAHVHNLIGDDL